MNNRNFEDADKNLFENSGEGDNSNAGFNVENDFDLSSSDSDLLDLNSYFSEDDIVELESDKTEGKPQKKNKKKKSIGKRILKVCLVFFLVGTIIVTTGGAAGFIWFAGFEPYPEVEELDLNSLTDYNSSVKLNYSSTIYVQDDKGEWVEYQRLHAGENRIPVKYNKDKADAKDPDYTGIPKNLADAFVAVEDKRFFDHEGVDWRRTLSAFLTMVTSQSTAGHGGSSITQQLIKNLTSNTDRSATRKIREIKSALYIEGKFSKEAILEAYMNTVAMANGLYGVESAAKYYFGKSVSELSLAECASLAGITNIPEYYRPDVNPENNLKRRNIILGLMLEQGYITEKEYDKAKAEELKVVADKSVLKEVEINNYFVDALIEDVIAALSKEFECSKKDAESMFYNGGLKIYSTLDPKVQEAMESVYTSEEFAYTSRKTGKPLQGSMVVMDYSGHVLGIVGGIGEKTENRGLNRATMSPRQPGSTMKPIAAYAPAIENDLITYSSVINDGRKRYGPTKWLPVNWYGYYKGNVKAEYALEISINAIPVYLVDLLTPQKSYDFLTQSLGIKNLTKQDINYAPLGMGGTNGGLTTRESAAAYAIFGNGGKFYEPITFTHIYDQSGDLLISNEKDPVIAISEETSVVMNKMLQNVVYGYEGTGGGVRRYVSNTRVYAKTGTSDSANDIWFVGGTPYYVGSSWCGYDQQEGVAKQTMAQNMWGAVMQKLHKGLPSKQFFSSENVICKPYCATTGLIARTGCPVSDYGWYKSSNAEYCTSHKGDKVSGTTESQAKKYISGYSSSGDKNNSSSSQNSSSGSSSSNSSSTPSDSSNTNSSQGATSDNNSSNTTTTDQPSDTPNMPTD